jgi:uncharacterized membrane protein YdjX (TVP38/TMEM64 family)
MMSRADDAPSSPSRLAYIVGFAVLGAVTLLGFAAPVLPSGVIHNLAPWLEAVRLNPWAPLAAIAAFVLLASVGVPQIVLITAIVAAFGPWAGLLYSWIGKMIACSIGFAVGRRFGAEFVARHSSERVAEVMKQLARRGFVASALIRLVPTVPSVLVNIAAGATPIRFRDFLAGTALGSIPKMALMAFGGHAAMVAVQANSLWAWLVLGITIVLWAVLAYVGRRWLRNRV